ncbi:MAG: ATP-binding protein [Ramlibacter sp.]|nr:ATP-binding protein [Ramlibacter sp.]
MRLTLQRKFFIALAVMLLALMLMFVGLSRWSLQRGLGPYVAEIELSRLDWIVANAQAAYAREGSWHFLRSEPNAWRAMQMPGGVLRAPPGRPPPDMEPGRFGPPPPHRRDGPRGGPESLFGRLSLLDANGSTVLAGQAELAEDALQRPIEVNGKTVAWLALAPVQGLGTQADRAFAVQQSRFVIFTGLAGLLIALLISIAMARRWLVPVEQLVDAARKVADGRLGVTVPVQGRDEFAELASTFNAMSSRLSAMEESRRQWLSDVAHELRTPVAAMRAEIESVQDGVRAFDESTARRMHGQVMRLGKLVDALRLVMHDERSQAPTTSIEFSPLAVLSDTVGDMQALARQRDIELEGLDAIAALQRERAPRLQGDPSRLAQVFTNLVENSLRYTHPGGHLQLGAQVLAEQKRLLIVFEDSAPAPREADFERLFDRFFRGDASRSRELGGAGLGLAICKAIVQAHGGTITAMPSPLGGLRIELQLPIITP